MADFLASRIHSGIDKKGAAFVVAAFWVFSGFLLAIAPSAQADAPLEIAYPNFPPFHWVAEDGNISGFFYEIITEALENRMGFKVVWSAYPWPRCQENLKAGKADAILTVPTEERASYSVTHEFPFYKKPLNVFTYSGHPRITEILKLRSLSDIKRAEFSVITYSGNGWHRENVASLKIKTFETPHLVNVWKMLSEKRGDIVIEWPLGAWPDIRRAGVPDRIKDTSVVIASMPFHLLVGKKSSYVGILPAFDETVRRMSQDGTIALILSKY